MSLILYYRLARVDKPVGVLLLWAPTAWALWVANQGHPSWKIAILFFLGTFLMRSAGCVLNDLADINIDLHVQRTKNRPLTSKALPVKNALLFLFFLLFLALLIVLQLPPICLVYAFIALGITIIYPFCKRIIQAPQAVLGIAFSMGIPMAFAASGVPFNKNTLLLLIINWMWTLAYDTQYAMADRVDDLKIGVKSSAILFAGSSQAIIICLQLIYHGLWLLLQWNTKLPVAFYCAWILGGCVFIYQNKLVNAHQYIQAFSSNVWYGLIMWGWMMKDILS